MLNFMYIFEGSYLEFIKKTSISKKHTLIFISFKKWEQFGEWKKRTKSNWFDTNMKQPLPLTLGVIYANVSKPKHVPLVRLTPTAMSLFPGSPSVFSFYEVTSGALKGDWPIIYSHPLKIHTRTISHIKLLLDP